MNDPGLDEPISKDAQAVENQHEDEQGELNEDEQEFLEPRYVEKWPFNQSTRAGSREQRRKFLNHPSIIFLRL